MSLHPWRLGVIILVLLVAACAAPADPGGEETPTSQGGGTGASGQQGTSGASVSGIPLDPDARYGGAITLHHTSAPETLPLAWTGCCMRNYQGWTYESLISYQTWGGKEAWDDAAYNNLVPSLATGWETSPDGLSINLQLREGVTWTDGEPFTCADAKFSIDTIRTGDRINLSPKGIHLSAIQSTECADDHTFILHLKEPRPYTIPVLAGGTMQILPEHIYGDVENISDAVAEDFPYVVGTGPFIAAEFAPQDHITYERNANYWDKPLPYLDGASVYLLSQNIVAASLRAGRIDYVAATRHSDANQLTQECDACWTYGAQPISGAATTIVPNFQRAPWNTKPVREAINLAVDRTKVAQLSDNIIVLPSGGLGYPGSGYEMPAERRRAIPGYNWEDPNYGEANKEMARQILADAGYEPGELTARIPYPSFATDSVPIFLDELSSIGINATTQLMDFASFYSLVATGDYDLLVHGIYTVTPNPEAFLYEMVYTSRIGQNYSNYSNPEFDRTLDNAASTLDEEERKKLLWDAMEIAMRDVVQAWMGFGATQVFVRDRVHGLLPLAAHETGTANRAQQVWVSD
jgi:peptide/nickel transport system substrate-binding protein